MKSIMITALAITYNEEQHIQRYIESLYFADEIIIIDALSTDRTTEIATSLGAKVITRKFDDFSSQKNFAIAQAKNNWIVFFDLDETIPKALAKEIVTIHQSSINFVAYEVKRQFLFMGKKIKYSGFQNDKAIRFFNKKYCSYNGDPVHEIVSVDGAIGQLTCKSEHYTYKNFDLYNAKLTNYSKLQAEKLYIKNLRPNIYHFFIRPLYRFLHQYIIRLGFLDRKEGFILAYLSAFAVFKRYLQLWLMYRHID